MLVAADYPFLDIVGTMIVFFGLVIWLRLLFTMFGDVFRRDDISGWVKTGWVILAIVLPVFGVLIYLVTQGRGVAERSLAQAQAAQGEFDRYVRETASSSGATAEIAQAKELLDKGAIDQAEFDMLKKKALA